MQVPLEWLRSFCDPEVTVEDLAQRLTMGGLEVEGIQHESTEEQPLVPVLDVYITPNRGDCLSILGVAREVSALYDVPITLPRLNASVKGGVVDSAAMVSVEEPVLCPRYAARVIRGVKVGPSPLWMQRRLIASGQRPINCVVDVTNYVMLELGQPLHAFDLNKLAGEQVVVRLAYDGESITTLDGTSRQLPAGTLVIADAMRAVAVAGVMGGENSEVSELTQDILLEAAHFQPLTVRRAARNLGMRSEASYRFERFVDPGLVTTALDRACQLLEEMGLPPAMEGHIDVCAADSAMRCVEIRVSRACELLGMVVSHEDVSSCLRRLGIPSDLKSDGDTLVATIPTYRPDLVGEEDLVEEVCRIYGYEKIPESLPQSVAINGGDNSAGKARTMVRRALAACGLQEVVCHSLTGPRAWDIPAEALDTVPVRNVLSTEVSRLRRSLLPGLLETARKNQAFGRQSMGLFELGAVWRLKDGEPFETHAVACLMVGRLTQASWKNSADITDFYTIRTVAERLLALAFDAPAKVVPLTPEEAALAVRLHPGRCANLVVDGNTVGTMGELHPAMAEQLGFKERVYLFEIDGECLAWPGRHMTQFTVLPRFPFVTRDIAPRLPVSIPYSRVEQAVAEAGSSLIAEVRLSDLYTGEHIAKGFKSLTLSLNLRSADHTLSESEIEVAVEQVRQALRKECNATFAGDPVEQMV